MTLRRAICATAVAAMLLSPPAMGNLIDTFGDAQDVFGAGDPLLDIDGIFVQYDERFLHFEMTFHTPISAPSAGFADGVVGLLELDTDQDTATGLPPTQNAFSPPFAMLSSGVDFVIALFTETLHPGFVDVLDPTGRIVDTVAIEYGPTSFSGSVPLASLGGDDGIVNFTTTIGTIPQPTDATDVVGVSKLVPAPPAVMLFAVAVVGVRRRRR
ncbi:MAG: hypothetical protein HKO59_10055 [Phycisphaerales bacterium]|nr:hypothetical protein [Phycisphaerae bacterium]NNF44005.1 hypothetical protein [Phycisphaerales bacterium]NNM26307.1 hypothetical protein [Phycisphaerales bacterium]